MVSEAKLLDMPVAPPHTRLDAPLRRVTLLEDRAQVVREGTARLEKGFQKLRVRSVAPVAGDRTLLVRSSAAGVRIDEAKVLRYWRIGAEEKPADAKELEEATRQLESDLRKRVAMTELLEQRRKAADHAANLVFDAIQREMPYAERFEERWPTDVRSFTGAVRSLDAEIDAASKDAREVEARLSALRLRQAELGRVDEHFVCEIEIAVTAEQRCEAGFSVQYLVPCAFWRPIHRATLLGEKVRFECEGALWQATGEDWTDVELFFSTARSRERSEPPVLSDDPLSARKKETKKTQVSVREQNIATTGEGTTKTSAELPGVDDGGETRLLGASTRATIPSDGRLRRVPISVFESAAEVDRIARPEKSSLVHLRSRQPNGAPHPLLAGPVELLRTSGYVGRSSIGFVAPGEKFLLGWGGDDALRIQRRTNEHRETAMLTSKLTITREVVLHVSNLESAPGTFKLEERVPVSEIDSVKIQIDEKETKPAAQADEQGIVGWKVEVPAHGTKEIKLVYRIVASSDVQGL